MGCPALARPTHTASRPQNRASPHDGGGRTGEHGGVCCWWGAGSPPRRAEGDGWLQKTVTHRTALPSTCPPQVAARRTLSVRAGARPGGVGRALLERGPAPSLGREGLGAVVGCQCVSSSEKVCALSKLQLMWRAAPTRPPAVAGGAGLRWAGRGAHLSTAPAKAGKGQASTQSVASIRPSARATAAVPPPLLFCTPGCNNRPTRAGVESPHRRRSQTGGEGGARGLLAQGPARSQTAQRGRPRSATRPRHGPAGAAAQPAALIITKAPHGIITAHLPFPPRVLGRVAAQTGPPVQCPAPCLPLSPACLYPTTAATLQLPREPRGHDTLDEMGPPRAHSRSNDSINGRPGARNAGPSGAAPNCCCARAAAAAGRGGGEGGLWRMPVWGGETPTPPCALSALTAAANALTHKHAKTQTRAAHPVLAGRGHHLFACRGQPSQGGGGVRSGQGVLPR